MSKSDAFETSMLKLIFNATTITGVADNTAASPNTNLYVSLHTADPGETGTQATNEATYTGYARVAVARTTAGWTVTGGVCNPAAQINFPAGTGGSGTVTYFGIGLSSSGAGTLLYSGPITPNIATGSGVQPYLTTATSIAED